MLALLGPFTDPTLLYTWSLKKVPLSGGASPYRPSQKVPHPPPPRASYIKQPNDQIIQKIMRNVSRLLYWFKTLQPMIHNMWTYFTHFLT